MPIPTKKILGFTMIEILVVMAIMAILAAIGIGSFGGVQSKARDAQRKSDLAAIARALEMFYNDHGRYPTLDSSSDMGTAYDATTNLIWGKEWRTSNGVIYMNKIPSDPKTNNYRYIPLRVDGAAVVAGTASNSPNSYWLFAHLENEEDAKAARSGTDPAYYISLGTGTLPQGKANANACNGLGCNYILRSPNAPMPLVTAYP